MDNWETLIAARMRPCESMPRYADPTKERKRRAKEALEKVQLGDRIDHRVPGQERLDVGRVAVLVGQPDRAHVLVRGDEVRDVRHFLDARHAPGRPVVDDDPVPALRGQVEALAIERADLERWLLRHRGLQRSDESQRQGDGGETAQQHHAGSSSVSAAGSAAGG